MRDGFTPAVAVRFSFFAPWSAFVLGAFLAPGLLAQSPPLHELVDQQISAGHVGPMSPQASDADFIRRIYLDLTGSSPSVADTRAFLADNTADKRIQLIDRLLASAQYARHMANTFDVMLMERRPDKNVPAADWQKYLYESLLVNKPYDVLVREILSSDGVDPATRPAAKFLLDRDADPNLLTRDVGRIFFGRDLQCAQCHDHPLVDDYYQADYYGLNAFFSRTSFFAMGDKEKKNVLMENAAGEVPFQSVFDPTAKGQMLPRVPGGQQIAEPRFAPGEEWVVAPAKDVRHIPKYSRRAQLAAQATAPTNRHFNRNIVNRLWAHMMGRGLVEPVDFHHSGNPPSHPQLLELLADQFAAMKYDVRGLLRELALSQTYQRSIDLPGDVATQAETAAANVAALEAEQARLEAIVQQSQAAEADVGSQLIKARAAVLPLLEEAAKASAPIAEIQKAIAAANQAVTEAQGMLTAKQDVASSVAEAAAKAKEASAKLPAEKEVADAAAKLQTRAEQLSAEVAALAKGVEEKAAAAKAAADQLVAINQSLAEINGRLDVARQHVIMLEAQDEAVTFKARVDLYQARLAKRRVAEAQAQKQFAAAHLTAKASQAAAQQLVDSLAAEKSVAAKLASDLPNLQAAKTAAERSHADTLTALSAARQTFEGKDSARQAVGEAAAKAQVALQKSPQDAVLATAAQTLKQRTDQLASEAAEAQKVVTTSDAASKAAAVQLETANQALAAATAQMAALTQNMTSLESQIAAAQQKALNDAQAAQQLASEIPERWSREFASRPLRQLTPEQFGWSVLQATGVTSAYVSATSAEIEKATPLSEAAKNDPTQLAARQRQIDETVYAKLAPNIGVFIQLFGAGAGQPQGDFFATVDQALFLANGGVVKSWLAPSGENLTARLLKLDDASQLASELYLSVLSRPASPTEVSEIAKYLAARPNEKALVVQELAWSLIGSAEFRFNH